MNHMIGRTISHYRILSELGSGGMGVVYRAEDLSLGRHVALKFLPTHLSSDPDARRRFVHEAKAAAALDHSGICTVHEVGEADGQPFIVMALLEGRTLKERIATGPLPLPEALEVAAQVAEALHEAHGKGVVHRDVKPANIMLTPKGQAKVMDFGLAQVAGASQLTRSGSTLGTAAYMSPEQARSEAVDRRTDIWSLGVVLYEMVSGRRPFPGEHEAALLYGIQQGEPEPLTALRTGVPVELERIVGKCLAKDAGRRYQHADELAVDLRQLLAGLGAAPTTASTRTIRPSRRAPIRVAALLLVLAIAAAGAWLFLRPGRGPSAADAALAVVDFEDLGGGSDSLSAAGLGGLLQVGLIEKCPVRVVSPEYLQDLRRRSFAGAQGPIKSDQALTVARKAGATLLLSGQVGRRNGSTFAVWRLVETTGGRGVWGQRVVQADLVGLADDIIAQVVPLIASRAGTTAPADTGSVGGITTTSSEAYRQFVAAEVALKHGTGNDVERLLQSAVQIDSTFALAWLRLFDFYYNNRPGAGNPNRCANKAWELRNRLGIKDRMMLEARRLMMAGQWTAGCRVYREMLSRWPDDRTILRTYVDLLVRDGFGGEAQIAAEQALMHFPDDEGLRSSLEWAYRRQGKTRETLSSARDYRLRHPGEADAWDRVGEAFLAAGEADSAEAVFRRARSLDPDDYSLQYDLARCAFLRGDPWGAAGIFEGLLARTDLVPYQRTQLRVGWQRWTIRLPGLVDCYAETGRLNQALALLEDWARDDRYYDLVRYMVLLDWKRPQAVLSLAPKPGEPQGPNYMRIYLRGLALAESDSLAAARDRLAELRAMKEKTGLWIHYAPLSLAARIALAEGRADSALVRLQELEAQIALVSPEWEYKARALRALGRVPQAAATLEELLHRNGSRFIARYQLGQIYEEMGRKADAVREFETFLKAWANADPGWPQVEDARRRLAALRASH
jgi:eukaryotic-like serine/threonine-protein kinase